MKNSKPSFILNWFELTKFKLSFVVALSPVAGYFMFGEIHWQSLIAVFVGTLLLSCAVIALNQYQERFIDAKMQRTQNRPLPAGTISPKNALTGIILLFGLGMLVLWFFTNPLTTLLGAINGVWYNLVYTPLKQKTAFAVIPGGLCGAIPPLMGWTAAGGYIWHPKIIVLALFFFVWQVPHFWLILLKFGREYEKAGLSSVTKIWNQNQLKGITFIWMISTGVAALLLPVFHLVNGLGLKILLLVFTLAYVFFTYRSLYAHVQKVNYFVAFIAINMFLISTMTLLVVQQFI